CTRDGGGGAAEGSAMPGVVVRLLVAAGVALVVWALKAGACLLALRVRTGAGPLPVDRDELAWRCALAAAGATLVTPVEVFALNDAFSSRLTSPVIWVAAFAVIPLGGLFFTWAFALEDYLDGVGVYALYSVFTAAVLFVCWLASVPLAGWMLR